MDHFQHDIRIPKERIAVLIGKHGTIKRKIEKAGHCTLAVDSNEGEVLIQGEDALSLYTTKSIVSAIGRGFNPEVALSLLDGNVIYEELDMSGAAKTKKHLIRIKGRIIGSEGKSRRVIEELTDVHICVYGKTIGVIGGIAAVGVAKKALESLLVGSPHSAVYNWLEKQRARMKREEALEDVKSGDRS